MKLTMSMMRRFGSLAWLPALLLMACCQTTAPLMSRPDTRGLQLQRRLIEDNFAGMDVRSGPGTVEGFRAGTRESVSAAWWGFDENDATSSLQASLDSGAKVILIPYMGTPWITQPLTLRSHSTVILQEGVEIISKRGSFQKEDNSLLALKDVENITLYGYGARLTMRKDDYRRAPYEKSEWRHAIELYGCTRISVLGLIVTSSGGDGVYLGRGTQTFNGDILLRDLTLRDHFRQGISVISAQDLRIENVEMSSTEGTPPSAGIDFEPNYPDEVFIRCLLKNCIIRSNAGPGVSVVLMKLDKASRGIDIRVEDSVVSNNPLSLLVGAGSAHGTIQFQNTRLHGIQLIWPPGSGVKIVGN
jgi:hypothetical protein